MQRIHPEHVVLFRKYPVGRRKNVGVACELDHVCRASFDFYERNTIPASVRCGSVLTKSRKINHNELRGLFFLYVITAKSEFLHIWCQVARTARKKQTFAFLLRKFH